jgi:anti-sigma-K factor RskA
MFWLLKPGELPKGLGVLSTSTAADEAVNPPPMQRAHLQGKIVNKRC